jgi:hypothetical protein
MAPLLVHGTAACTWLLAHSIKAIINRLTRTTGKQRRLAGMPMNTIE